MDRRLWLVAAAVLAAWGWWRSPVSLRRVSHAHLPAGTPCPPALAPRLSATPLQTAVPAGAGPFPMTAAALRPLAGFHIDARVLSRRDYGSGREAAIAPTDLALGWSRMADPAVLEQLQISQSNRWYFYRWRDLPPIPPVEMARSSANMHMVPADPGTARALARVRAGERVRIDGWLVEARAPDGWTWRSSLRRDDVGEGACEVVYVCRLQRL